MVEVQRERAGADEQHQEGDARGPEDLFALPHAPRFYLPECGFPVARLPIEDVPSDFRNTLFLRGPVGLDVGGVEIDRTLELRGVALVVHRLGDGERTVPFFARGIGQRVEFGPRKRTYVAAAPRIPVL